MIWFGWLLWHINPWRLFNAKSSLYIYIKYFWFGLVGFYGISTIVGYLMPNSVYTYISNIWLDNLYFVDNVFKQDIISYVCTQLNDFKYCYVTVTIQCNCQCFGHNQMVTHIRFAKSVILFERSWASLYSRKYCYCLHTVSTITI